MKIYDSQTNVLQRRKNRHGQETKSSSPESGKSPRSLTPQEAEKFWAKVDVKKIDECWGWKAAVTNRGYGNFWVDGSHQYAHRVVFVLTKGQIPFGMHVCHTCDNRKCVNPSHLFLGTRSDNMRDMISKGRGNKARGERQGSSKLKSYQVKEIRKLYAEGITQTKIAQRFGVHFSNISLIVRRKKWNHI